MPFVAEESIVRKIWGRSDTVLFVFAGAAAEFALNKSVDWLYFTGRLPADPINRLFSTVTYAHRIIFSAGGDSVKAIDQISSIHKSVEHSRGYDIPDWAYRDVLYMLIDYSHAAYELLERKMTEPEKEELFNVFLRVGQRMGLRTLPATYHEWTFDRQRHLAQDLACSPLTRDLFKQYRRHLGWLRYNLLTQVQKLIAPARVKLLLNLSPPSWIRPLLAIYGLSRKFGVDWILKSILLPRAYYRQVRALDLVS